MQQKRVLSSGAFALVLCAALMKAGEWLANNVLSNVTTPTTKWYETVLIIIGAVMAIAGFVLAILTLFGAFDEK